MVDFGWLISDFGHLHLRAVQVLRIAPCASRLAPCDLLEI
jgi:hypothetical protein